MSLAPAIEVRKEGEWKMEMGTANGKGKRVKMEKRLLRKQHGSLPLVEKNNADVRDD